LQLTTARLQYWISFLVLAALGLVAAINVMLLGLPAKKGVLIMLKSVLTFVLFASSVSAAGAQQQMASALLEGVAQARSKISSISCELDIESGQNFAGISMESRDGFLRVERSDIGGELVEVIVRNGDIFHAFSSSPHSDVHLYDLSRATGVRGDIAFDPRVLGLSTSLSSGASARRSLAVDYGDPQVVREEDLANGDKLYHVKNSETRSSYWIQQPSFRVHKRTIAWSGGEIEVVSEFDSDNKSVLPSKVTITRSEKEKPPKTTIMKIKNITIDKPISDQRFSCKSMALPLNTSLVDYRTSQHGGFWNGEEFVSERTSPPVEAMEASGKNRLGWLSKIAFFAASIGLLIFWRRKLNS